MEVESVSNIEVVDDLEFYRLEVSVILYHAVKDENIHLIRHILEDKTLVNIPVQKNGPLAGYTALHVACMEKNRDIVKMLVEEYHADVNIVAEDGTQPIHLVCIYSYFNDTIEILLKNNADIEAEIGQDIFSKHMKNEVWYSNFCDKMTIATFAVLYGCPLVAETLIKSYKAKSNIKDSKNKTLLMYAIEKDYVGVARSIVLNNSENKEYINTRDDEGYCAIHYIFHPKKYGGFRYDGTQICTSHIKWTWFKYSIDNYPDIYATVNNNPETLLLNMAAYRISPFILIETLPYYENIKDSKALYLATLSLKDPQKYFRINSNASENLQWLIFHKYRKYTIMSIVKDLINRLTFSLFVPKGEEQLLNNLIVTNKDIREIAHNYQKDYINGTLKNLKIQYGEKSITLFDFISLCCNDKKVQRLVRDEIFMNRWRSLTVKDNEYFYHQYFTTMKIYRARNRVELLDQLKTVKHLRKAISLPYECILCIIEFLDNKELGKFINSFYM